MKNGFGLVPGATRSIGLDNFLTSRIEKMRLRHPGAVAQLGERLICIQEVAGSIPTSSTSIPNGPVAQVARAHP